jgi:hypothetical protein
MIHRCAGQMHSMVERSLIPPMQRLASALLLTVACTAFCSVSLFGQFKDTANVLPGIPAGHPGWSPFDGPTIWVQAACGIGFAGAGIALGYAAKPKEGDASGVGTGIAEALGLTIAAIGLPLGTYLGGQWMGGNGGWWATLGGCVVGGCVGLLPNIFIKYDNATVTAIVFCVTAVAGGIVGYHLTASPVSDEQGAGSTLRLFSPTDVKRSGDLALDISRPNVRITVVSIRL